MHELNGWLIRDLNGGEPGSPRILQYTLSDERLRPMPLHQHLEDVHLLSLSGHVLMAINGVQQVLSPGQSTDIKGGAAHSLTPLAPGVRLLATFTNGNGSRNPVASPG